ncbi:MAG: hypothetical protein CMJ17_17065 [Phenylobacterium sp.]|nr:hypothetical protein [Phenylobacterium sp.]
MRSRANTLRRSAGAITAGRRRVVAGYFRFVQLLFIFNTPCVVPDKVVGLHGYSRVPDVFGKSIDDSAGGMDGRSCTDSIGDVRGNSLSVEQTSSVGNGLGDEQSRVAQSHFATGEVNGVIVDLNIASGQPRHFKDCYARFCFGCKVFDIRAIGC